MKSIILVAVSLVISSAFVNAQMEFLPGHIVLSNGDTIKGEVGYKEWMYNPETVNFRNEEKGKLYNIDELKAFTIEGKDTYRRFNVSYYLSASDLSEAKKEFGDKIETKAVWLRLIYKGTADLYELNTKQRPYFFITVDSVSVSELVYRVRLENNELYKDESYKIMLAPFAEGNSSAEKILNMIGYTKKDIISFFNSVSQQQINAIKKPKRKVKADISCSLFIMPIIKANSSISPIEYDNTIGGSVGSGVTFISDRGFGKYQVRVGGNINYMTYKAKYFQNTPAEYSDIIGCVSLEPVVKLSYIINPLERLRHVLGAEVGYNTQVGKNVKENYLYEEAGFGRFSFGYSIAGSFGQIGLSASIFTFIGVITSSKFVPMNIALNYCFFFKK